MISQKYFCEASNGHFAKGLKWTQNWTLEKQNDYVVIRSFLWGLKCTLSGVDPKWFSFSDKRHFHSYLTKWTIVSIIDFSLWRGYRTLNSCNLQKRMFKDTLYKMYKIVHLTFYFHAVLLIFRNIWTRPWDLESSSRINCSYVEWWNFFAIVAVCQLDSVKSNYG